MHFCVCFQNNELQRQMACTVLSAFVSLRIQVAKTDNQPYVLWIVQRTNTLKKTYQESTSLWTKLDTENSATFLWKQINTIINLKEQEQVFKWGLCM